MKKFKLLFLLLIGVCLTTGCSTKNKDALAFKEEYESINGVVNKNGKEHRTLNIPEDNPYKKVTAKEILEKIENKETFYVYFGDKLCPWCRSVIEKSIEVAKSKDIKQIYYVNIWDDEGNEILRDKYELKDGKPVKTIDGAEEYQKLLEVFKDLLNDYNLTDSNGKKVSVGEKRIYAPNYIYVKDGEAVKLTEGISEKQKDAREELTDEILKDEENLFNEFFQN